MNRLFRPVAVLGLMTLLGGLAAATPALADGPRDIHRDEVHLHDLQRRRDFLASRHDWGGVRRLDIEINGLRLHIENDRRDVYYNRDYRWDNRRDRDDHWHRDRDDYRRRDRDDYRHRDRDDHRDRDHDGHYRYDNR